MMISVDGQCIQSELEGRGRKDNESVVFAFLCEMRVGCVLLFFEKMTEGVGFPFSFQFLSQRKKKYAV